MKRAAVCIGVNRPTGMAALSAAARDAADFKAWAEEQGCDAVLLADGAATTEVTVADVFKAVKGFVRSGTYDQLIVYFSGHGILLAPGAEYWLLSGGPENPNEAVNLLRSVEDARNSGIPHVVFVSDACRSAANTTTLRGVTGGLIFPPQPSPRSRSEIDVYYATLPGDPANEVPEADATQSHRGLFTDCLLAVVERPPQEMIESAAEGAATISVLTSRRLKSYLEAVVPEKAADIDVRLNQSPEIRVETALPKYFARVEVTRGGAAPLPAPRSPAPTVQAALRALGDSVLHRGSVVESLAGKPARTFASELGLDAEVARLARTQGRGHFETRTGFTVHGAQVLLVTSARWNTDPPFQEPVTSGGSVAGGWHIRLEPQDAFSLKASSILIELDTGTATVLPVLPGFIGTVVVEGGRVISVNFRPSEGTWRFGEYRTQAARLDEMKAFAAVAARVGRFEVEREKASQFADRIRQAKGIDPIMGLYAAYAYAQAGELDDVYSVFTWMRQDEIELPIPFDVAMLALRHKADALEEPDVRIAPFVPMLSQGWALLMPGDRMHRAIHQQLRPHLVPSLFTTLDAEGARVARMALTTGEEK